MLAYYTFILYLNGQTEIRVVSIKVFSLQYSKIQDEHTLIHLLRQEISSSK